MSVFAVDSEKDFVHALVQGSEMDSVATLAEDSAKDSVAMFVVDFVRALVQDSVAMLAGDLK